MDEYIKKLLEQVRFQKAHKAIHDEIKAHIEEQIEANIADGMDRETAEKQAVRDMGDPVEAGISLDAVHRPQMAWGIVMAAVIVGVIGSVIHMFIMQDAVTRGKAVFVSNGRGFILFTVLGIIAMMLVYLLDYTVIARYSKIIAIPLFLALFFAGDELGIIAVVGHTAISSSSLMLLLIPFYGGILYSFRGGKSGALIKSLLWIIIPGYLVFWYHHKIVGIVFVVSMLVQLTIAIVKGWIKVPKMPVIAAIWTAFTLLPCALIWLMYYFMIFAQYQIDRINFMLDIDSEAYYFGRTIRGIFKSIGLFGSDKAEIIGVIPNPDNHYILTYIVGTWGIMAGLVVISAVGGLIIYGFTVSSKSKNQLGLVMGSGCMTALAVNAAFNICEGFAILPFFSSFLPFISSGGSNLIVSYVFLGMIMSIYKYKNIYPEHIEIKKKQINLKIQI